MARAEDDRARVAALGDGAVEFFLTASKVELMDIAWNLAAVSNGVGCDDDQATMRRLRDGLRDARDHAKRAR